VAVRLSAFYPPQEDSWYEFMLEAVNSRIIVRLKRAGKLKKSNNFSGNRTCDLPDCGSASTNYITSVVVMEVVVAKILIHSISSCSLNVIVISNVALNKPAAQLITKTQ
jgi:hypothetical protein